jgi:hypothetical protein
MWDLSESNSSEEARIEAITEIAKVCRNLEEIKDKQKLYNHLLIEHAGKPGEIFQFIPAIITDSVKNNIERWGVIEYYNDGYAWGKYRLLTNLRAMLTCKEGKTIFNDSVKGFYAFKCKLPMMIVPQILRHGQLSFMQQSERYTQIREYLYCDEFENIRDEWCGNIKKGYIYKDWNTLCYNLSQRDWDLVQSNRNIRKEITNKGSHGLAMTTLWIAGWKQDESQWDNFFAVRCHKKAQLEVRQLANEIKQMMEN